jgi:hypothetical protein
MVGIIKYDFVTRICAVAILTLFAASLAGGAQAQQKRWTVTGSIGFEVDDNVGVDEVDNNTSLPDEALLIELGGTYKPQFGDSYGLELGYDFSQSVHEDLDDFDLQTHSLSASVEREIAPWDLGFTYLYSRSLLGGDDFLGIHSLTPTLGRSLTDRWYVSLRYGLQVKDFIQNRNDARDAVNNGLTFDNFVFFDQSRSFISAGYRIEDENTDGDEFDYIGHFLHVRAKVRLPIKQLQSFNPTMRLGYQFSKKDFSNNTPSIGAERDDERMTFSGAFSLDLTDKVNTELAFETIEAVSNLASADFNETIVTIKVGVKY